MFSLQFSCSEQGNVVTSLSSHSSVHPSSSQSTVRVITSSNIIQSVALFLSPHPRPESSWVCGVFIAGGRSEPPLAEYYRLPPQLTDCPAKFAQTWKKGKFSKKCGRLGQEWEKNWLTNSNTEETWTPFVNILSSGKYNRDVCTLVKQVTASPPILK